jgi:glutathione S-transferase
MDFPNLPYLIDDGMQLTEMNAVMHYICVKWNPKLLGVSAEEQGRV